MLEDREAIERRALELLLHEPADERERLLGWAQDEMLEHAGVDPYLHRGRGPHQGVHDLIHAPGLFMVMRARGITTDQVLGAETFEDLIHRLLPGIWDD